MRLSYIFEQLTKGELAQLSLGGTNNIGIQPSDYASVLPHINIALSALYTRFPLKMSEVTIQQFAHIDTYYLESQFAETNTDSNEVYKYIMDSEYQPFVDNVLKIEKVFNEAGEELFLNDFSEYYSVHTPTYNSVQIPYPCDDNNLAITYRASHVIIEEAGLDPLEYDVKIPPHLLEALLFYVGHRATGNTNDDTSNGNNYLAKYEAFCLRVEEENLLNNDNISNTKLEKNGWV